MICRNCKKRIPDDSIICPKCKKPAVDLKNTENKNSPDRRNLAIIMTAAIIMVFFSMSAMPFIIGRRGSKAEPSPHPNMDNYDNSVVLPAETAAPEPQGSAEPVSAESEQQEPTEQTAEPEMPTTEPMPEMPTAEPITEIPAAEPMPEMPTMPAMSETKETRKTPAPKKRATPEPTIQPMPTPPPQPTANIFGGSGRIIDFEVPTLDRSKNSESEQE